MRTDAVVAETVDLLRDLVRIDTSNPPGNEVAAAEYLAKWMEREGLSTQVLVSDGKRGSVVARLAGGRKEPLLLLGHLDVVPADRAQWSVDPFAAEMKDGVVYGRGTLDMKGMLAIEAATLVALKREGVSLDRDVIFAGVADEEMGGGKGAGWLVKNHWDKVRAAYVINEGGGGLVKDGKRIFYCQCAEKGICWAKMRVRGSGGHASMPHSENPTVTLAQAVARLGSFMFPPVRNEITVKALSRLEKAGLLPEGMTAENVLGPDEDVGRRLMAADHRTSAVIRNTVTPTAIRGGSKTNVIPQVAEVDLDCRAFPEIMPSELLRTVRDIVDDPRVEIEVTRDSRGSASPIDTPLWDTIERTVKAADPDAVFVPYQSAGGTDSGYFRARGAVCYGVDPYFVTESEWDTVHGNDERIRIECIEWGLNLMYDIVRRFCGG